MDYQHSVDVIKAKNPLVKPIDPQFTCITEFNAYTVSYSLSYQGAGNVSYIDRALCLAYSKSCKSALVISEEHEFSDMPAQLTVTPVIDYKIAREHEKLIEIYYGDRDEDNLNRLVEAIRNIVKDIGGAPVIDSTVLLSHEEEVVQESFLYLRGEKLEAKLKLFGFTVISTTVKDVLEGADIFGQSLLYDDHVIFSKDQ
eukprot:TRINITY_DN2119_c0_g2_i3.p2 TRINITY_DN2119_c0_g2~~TRINITY_DN2119_c0_g2_i3.p2  ORF type:complete len:199 (+),score=24.91 TRINITY_DN2119_c0_g2_i3:728-1324(+)